MEASALHAPAGITRIGVSAPLLRLRSDEQLIALFRAGSDDAFSAIHDRYRQRLFAYVRQMLSTHSRQDAEDVLQDVFVRAYGSLRSDGRELNLRAWLYRVAHNRCIDYLRRPTPPAAEIFELSRKPLHDPMEEAQRREDLRRLVGDVGRLPEQQRSALLMREIDGMAYADIAGVLSVTVPAVKSLLVRARVGLVEAAEAREIDCEIIRGDLMSAYDRGVKASGRARRHMRECQGCCEYRTALRSMRRSFASLYPVAGAGPLAIVAKLTGLGGAAGGGTAAAGGVVGSAGAVGACKVAAVVCTAALATGGAAVEVKKIVQTKRPAAAQAAPPASSAPAPSVTQRRAALTSGATTAPAAVAPGMKPGRERAEHDRAAAGAPLTEVPASDPAADPADLVTGGAIAPVEEVLASDPAGSVKPGASTDGGDGASKAPPAADPASQDGDGSSQQSSGSSSGSAGGSEPPPEH